MTLTKVIDHLSRWRPSQTHLLSSLQRMLARLTQLFIQFNLMMPAWQHTTTPPEALAAEAVEEAEANPEEEEEAVKTTRTKEAQAKPRVAVKVTGVAQYIPVMGQPGMLTCLPLSPVNATGPMESQLISVLSPGPAPGSSSSPRLPTTNEVLTSSN